MDDMQKEIDKGLGQSTESVFAPKPWKETEGMQKALRSDTAREQMNKFDRVERDLFNRLRRDKQSIAHEFEARASKIRRDADRKILDETMRLEAERDNALASLRDEFEERARETELLLRRFR